MPTASKKLLFQGNTKDVYEGIDAETIMLKFKDTVFDPASRASVEVKNKGVLSARICEFIMSALDGMDIPTHFIRRLNERDILVHKAKTIPLKVTMHNVAFGKTFEALGLNEGTELPRSVMEFYYKDGDFKNPMLTEEHITALGFATYRQLEEIAAHTLRINDFLSGLFLGIGIKLAGLSLEYGILEQEHGTSQIILIDEITPDNCKLWDLKTKKKLDKERVVKNLIGGEEGYYEVAKRFGVLTDNRQ